MTRHYRFLLIGLALAAISLAITLDANAGTVVKAPIVTKQELPPVGPFPDVVCNEDTLGDIYIGPDGMFWECVCEKLYSGALACDWYDVPPSDKANARKKMRTARKVIRIKRGLLYAPRVRPVIA